MSETNTKKEGINWASIGMVLGVLVVCSVVWSAIVSGEVEEEEVPEVVSAEEPGFDPEAEPVEVDVFNDGRIIVDGAEMSLRDFLTEVPRWKEQRKLISFYRERRTVDGPSAVDGAGEAVRKTGVSYSPRFAPQ